MSIDVNVQNDLVIVTESSEDITVNVSNAPGPAGVGVPTGGSTGQVLKKASATNYDTYWAVEGGGVPYSGATGDVNLGEFALSAGQVTLDTTPTGTASVATTRWNDAIGISETTLKGGNVVLKNGVDLVARVVNKVSPNTTLTKAAYQAVKISGAQGQRLAVALAQANNDANSADTIGLVTETIATNQEGFIMTMGNLEGINTTGSLQGETWADGDVLYLSPTTAGALTNIKPTGATGHIVVVGYVEYAHANNGKIYCKIMNGWELDELHNVYITSPANNDALIYESATSLWKNKTIATALGYTPVPTTRTLTINGTAYDLSADRSWTVSAAANTIYTADGTLAGDRTITSNGNSLTILGGKETYANIQTALVLQGSATNKYVEFHLKNTNASGRTYGFRSDTDGKLTILNYTLLGNLYQYDPANTQHTFTGSQVNLIGSSITNVGLWLNTTSGTLSNYTLYNNSGITLLNATTDIRLGISNSEKMRITNAGRLLLGLTAESTFLLDVNGTARVSGGVTSTAANAFLAYDGGVTNQRFGIGTSTNTLNVFTGDTMIFGTQLDSSNLTKSNSVMWFGTEKNLIIGGATSSLGANYKLQVTGRTILTTGDTNPVLTISNTTTSSNAHFNCTTSQYNAISFLSNSVIGTSIFATGSSFSFGTYSANELNLMSNSNGHVTLRVNNVGDVNIKAKNSDVNNSTTQFKLFGATGNILLQDGGTFTDAGYRLDVQGTARVSGNLRQTNGNNYIDIISNANGSAPYIDFFYSGVQAGRIVSYISMGGNFVAGNGWQFQDGGGTPLVQKVSQLFSTGTIESKGPIVLSSASENRIQFFQPSVAYRGNIGVASGTSYIQVRTGQATNLTDGTLSQVWFESGNVAIGTSTTDAGYRLDVQGTARVSGQLTGRTLSNSTGASDYAIELNGISTTDATTRILINCGTLSSTGAGFGARALQATISDYGVGTFINANGNSSIGHVVTTASNSLSIRGFAVRTNGQGTNGSIAYTWFNGNNVDFYHSIHNDGTYHNLRLYNSAGAIYYVRDLNTTNITFGSNTYNASAQVAIDSTTKGFLPPRMTTTQKNAIGTPAAGLMVFDTTLVKLCVYNGTAWETITSI